MTVPEEKRPDFRRRPRPRPSPTDRAPLRRTHQREAIREAILLANRPLSPRELADAAQGRAPGVGIATVYRTVKQLIELGWLTSIELPGEPPRYELAGKVHHHHFRCRTCDGVFEIPGCSLTLDRGLPKGFRLDHHEVVLYGRCDSCSSNAEPS